LLLYNDYLIYYEPIIKKTLSFSIEKADKIFSG